MSTTAPALPARRPAVARRLVAWLLVIMLFPGAREALTDLGHYIVDGHAAHDPCASEHDAHGHDATGEHGCSGLFHTCRCCPAPAAVVAGLTHESDRVEHEASAPGLPRRDDGALEAHTEPPFRPPAA